MSRPNIELNISELVLEGFAGLDGATTAATMQAELTRLLSEQGLPASLTGAENSAEVNSRSFQMKQNVGSQEIGLSVARELYNALTR